MKHQTKNFLKILLAILLLCCLLKMPYSYFQIVRFVGMTIFIILAYLDKDKTNKTFMIIWICSALLMNPFIKVALGRTIWNIVDVVLAILLVMTILLESKGNDK